MTGPSASTLTTALAAAGEPLDGELTLERLGGGASRELWTVSVGGERRYVLRRDPPGEPPSGLAEEFAVMRAAAAAGVPVPRPVCVGEAGLLMAYVDGESLPRRVQRIESIGDVLPAQLAAALRALRSLPAQPHGERGQAPFAMSLHAQPHGERGQAPFATSLHAQPPRDPVDAVLAESRAEIDASGAVLPALELGLRWLDLHRPEPVEPVLVHGDFRLSNLIVGPEGLRAVIDWEFHHVGDPAEDVAWVALRPWRFGSDALPVAGVGPLEPLLDDVVDADRVRYWSIALQARWAAYCLRQARLRRESAHRSLERTVLARRVPEAEWDLLELIG